MRATLVAAALAAVVSSAPAQAPLGLLPDLPLDREGIPTRRLEDAELHRLLLALSATYSSATVLLATCHAAGRGYGAPGWRACVEGRRPD